MVIDDDTKNRRLVYIRLFITLLYIDIILMRDRVDVSCKSFKFAQRYSFDDWGITDECRRCTTTTVDTDGEYSAYYE